MLGNEQDPRNGRRGGWWEALSNYQQFPAANCEEGLLYLLFRNAFNHFACEVRLCFFIIRSPSSLPVLWGGSPYRSPLRNVFVRKWRVTTNRNHSYVPSIKATINFLRPYCISESHHCHFRSGETSESRAGSFHLEYQLCWDMEAFLQIFCNSLFLYNPPKEGR